jgi:hypothetical protein
VLAKKRFALTKRSEEKTMRGRLAKTQEIAIEELFVVENAIENGTDGLQQPRAHWLTFGIEQALDAGYRVGVLEFVLHSRSPFCATAQSPCLWGRLNQHISNIAKKSFIRKGQDEIF